MISMVIAIALTFVLSLALLLLLLSARSPVADRLAEIASPEVGGAAQSPSGSTWHPGSRSGLRHCESSLGFPMMAMCRKG